VSYGDDPRDRLNSARLYLCTDSRRDRADLAEFLDVVLAKGVDMVQLREKGLEAREEMQLAEVVAAAADRHGALWSINDRADLAVACNADVLHLGQDDLPVSIARAIVGARVAIGTSTHAHAEVDGAVADTQVDYYCVGPTWPTPTKPGRAAPGVELLRYAAAIESSKPWFAIGGIDLTTIDDVVAAGARRAVVVRAITEADDPGSAAASLAARLASPV
jgi:thiamine-phosphate pyrophosphorylase